MLNKNTSSLGRGLSSLIPQKNSSAVDSVDEIVKVTAQQAEENDFSLSQAGEGDQLIRVRVDQVDRNPMQPRARFDTDTLDELAASIKEHGILQPLVVTKKSDGRYELILGERRLRAAKRALMEEVPAIVREADRQQKLELALVENIIRENLNPVELAEGYKKFVEEFELTHEEAAFRLGKSRSTISNTIRLLLLPEEILEALREKRLSDAHAVILLGLPDKEKQLELFKRIVERNLSVARARLETQRFGGTKGSRVKVDVHDDDLTKKLRQYLGTRVKIERMGYRGRIVIEFFNYDELVELVDKILNEE